MNSEFAFITARTKSDWEQWCTRNVDVGEEGLTIAKKATLETDRLGFEAIDFDTDPSGNLTVLSTSGDVCVYMAESGELVSLSLDGYDSAGLSQPSAVGTIGEQLYLVDEAEGRIAAFSRRRRSLDWTTDIDMKSASILGTRHRAYLLDSGAGSDDGCVYTLDPENRATRILSGLDNPTDITVDTADTLSILAESGTGHVVLRATSDAVTVQNPPKKMEITLPEDFTPKCVSTQTAETLYLSGVDGDGNSQLIQYDLQTGTSELLSLPNERWATLRRGTSGTEKPLYLQSSSNNSIWKMREAPVNKKDPESNRYEGRLIGRFDSGSSNIQWHRTTLDADQFDPDTRIDVSYYTSNGDVDGIDDFTRLDGITQSQIRQLESVGIDGLWDLIEHTKTELMNVLLETEPEVIERWLEQAQDTLEREFTERDDIREATDPEDMLLTEATGRYLHMEIRLVGRRNSWPRLRSIKTYCPRKSYIRYLPEIYTKQDYNSKFLSHFLSLFESVFVDIEEALETHTEYLDPDTIPVEYLSWLNEWLAIDLGGGWPEQARRELISRAPELYKIRGTKQGLSALLQLYLDHVDLPQRNWEPSLARMERRYESLVADGYVTSREAADEIERYRARSDRESGGSFYFVEHDDLSSITDEMQRKAYSDLIGHSRRFQVLLSPNISDSHQRHIEEIIDSEKPVYTDTGVKQLDKRFQLGQNTYLGINTVCPSRESELGESTLGRQTILGG